MYNGAKLHGSKQTEGIHLVYSRISNWRSCLVWTLANSGYSNGRDSANLASIAWYLLTYLRTSWSRVLLEKLTGFQLVKKFPAYWGTRRFITAVTSARHLSLSSASSIQSMPPHLTSWRSILILWSHLRLGLPSGLFTSGFQCMMWQIMQILTYLKTSGQLH